MIRSTPSQWPCWRVRACVAAGDDKDTDPIKEKLFAAKRAYDEGNEGVPEVGRRVVR